GVDKFDNLDDEHQLLLHGERLVDLPNDLHDLRPVIDELRGFLVERAKLYKWLCAITVCELVEQIKVVLDLITVEVMAEELLNVISLIVRDPLPGNNGEKLDDGFEKFFTHESGTGRLRQYTFD